MRVGVGRMVDGSVVVTPGVSTGWRIDGASWGGWTVGGACRIGGF